MQENTDWMSIYIMLWLSPEEKTWLWHNYYMVVSHHKFSLLPLWSININIPHTSISWPLGASNMKSLHYTNYYIALTLIAHRLLHPLIWSPSSKIRMVLIWFILYYRNRWHPWIYRKLLQLIYKNTVTDMAWYDQ